MAEITLTEMADRYERAATEMRVVAERLTGATVVRSQTGNLATIRADGAYAGYIETLTGEVVAFDDERE